MSALNLIYSGRLGFESRNLSRRAHRPDFQAEPLEQRKLLANGLIVGPVPLANPSPTITAATIAPPTIPNALSGSATTATPPPVNTAAPTPVPGTPAILPTDNSSSTNTPGVSPMVPAPLDVALDGSASVTTSPSSAISALIPETTGFVSFNGGPVFIVPMPDSTLGELAIATPENDAPSSSMFAQWSTSPVVLHAINAPVPILANNPQGNSSGANNPPVVLQNQPGVFIPAENVGQGLQTEPGKPLEPKLGPPADPPPLIDVVNPFQPAAPGEPGKTDKSTPDQPNAPRPGTEQPKGEQPKTDQPKTDQPKIDQPTDAPPARDAQPARSLPIPIPIPIPGGAAALDHAVMPEGSGAISSRRVDRPSDVHPVVSAAFGVVAAAGSYRLAMGESRRFGMHWLPSRVASSRSARPSVHGR